jgi:dTDP-4-dehydrorhamnose 3,5-epimerase
MIFLETVIEGVWVVEPERHEDERGFFARTWDTEEFAQRGLNGRLVQCSISYNRRLGTLRGMHYQAAPHEEAKLVRCTSGSIFDVAVDLRTESATFRRCCAHGFLTLTDDSEVTYQISEVHTPAAARGLRWNDPAIGIDWPADVLVVNERDRSYPDFAAETAS